MYNLSNLVRVVAILVVLYSGHGIWKINEFNDSVVEAQESTDTLLDTILNFDNYNTENFESEFDLVTEDYIEKNFTMFFGLIDLQRSLPALIVAIVTGIYFVFDPLAIYLRHFINYSFKFLF